MHDCLLSSFIRIVGRFALSISHFARSFRMRISHITYSDFRSSQITIARYRQATVATQRAFRFFAIFLYLFINYATGNRQMIIIFIIIAQLIYLILITYFRREHHVT